ncbi:threonine-phosphate decarboxylase CobD [Mesorhizobium sp.]|uniref:threonine-phosphate decarboxylase CobD n=1 Tax=Mesorhizobium sp. TaxID=1871066 RepID=UPI000FE335CA|nr:threonine-phosphate decarboxylase CobD [Mesorhizobium sp.]RWN52293.1 MAG: threonine-phosphate decarboxylase [Mesorhizobium sp.]RWN75755.1 MAG: threonine-phosphate decarboxylase [Mesorhizobium sp.]RWN77122.1 MAG: threonine-phosphate decarboxylase [Mesorhizobium sp.]RWN87012.1 MAG: threonine-phosphate decarboxylase [Mesorhizobium sp.]RWO11364.1 MAG: threonine-phosphate decarboxylase [Mesorhizobium sp.]
MKSLDGAAAVVDHGGSLGRARALFPHAPQPFVDLSTGINPHSYPFFELPATALSRLPEAARVRDLADVAASAYGAPSAANVVAAPGTQILLPRVASLVSPGKALVLGPTYAEHQRAAAIAGHAVTEIDDFDTLAGADLAIVVNPNNPDGRIVERKKLLALAERLRARGGLLVVDEAFMDVGPLGESLAGDVEHGGIVVLRSFGKFFGLAGLRLGFALADALTVERLEAQFGPWAVAGPALEYGIRALADSGWQAEMWRRLARDAARLDALFGRFGIPVAGGTTLFRYVRLRDAAGLFSGLGERGILLRQFSGRPEVLRAGLPGEGEEWQRLESALADWSQQRDDGA